MSTISKIQVVRDDKNGVYERVYVKRGLKSFIITDQYEIAKILEEFRQQEGVELASRLLGNKKFELISKYNPEKAKEGVFEINPHYEDVTNAWANNHRISNAKLNKNAKYKEAKEVPKKRNNFKRIVIGTAVGAIAVSLVGCGLSKLINKDKKNATKLTSTEANIDDYQLTDREILEKDFDYYADNYQYDTQMEVAYTAQAFLEQANTNIKNLNLKTEDGKGITGLFNEEEAWVYAITIHNLGVDEIVEIYQDSKFDYAKFEDTKQMLIKKMMQYQMLVAFNKVEQLDFTANFMTPHDEFVKEVFDTLATDIENIGKNLNDKTAAKESIKTLHDDLVKYTESGKLSQNVQDMLQLMYSPAYFSGVLTETAISGKQTYFTEKFGEELVGKGVCSSTTLDNSKEITDAYRSQHDNAWADAAENLRAVQELNNEEYEKILNDKNGYIYWMNEAREELANKKEREDKHLYAEITKDNNREIHFEAEKLVTNYLTSEKNLVEGTEEFNQEFNNIITDKQDNNLTVETLFALLHTNAKDLGIDASIDGLSQEELEYQLSLAMDKEIAKAMLEVINKNASKGGKGGSTALPKDEQKVMNVSREQAVKYFGEAAVVAAEKEAHDNEASKKQAEAKAEDVKQKAEENLNSGKYEEFIENAGKHDPANKDEYEENAKEAVENKKETEEIESQGPSGKENITQDYEKEEGKVVVDQGTIPEGAHTGKIEWSNGETLGENSDKPKEEVVEDPTKAIQETAPAPEPTPEPTPEIETNTQSNVSGGEVNYDIPQDMFEPVAYSEETDSVDATAFYAAVADVLVEDMAANPEPTVEESNVLTK